MNDLKFVNEIEWNGKKLLATDATVTVIDKNTNETLREWEEALPEELKTNDKLLPGTVNKLIFEAFKKIQK